MKRLKDGKAAGINEILGKVWKYEGEEKKRGIRVGLIGRSDKGDKKQNEGGGRDGGESLDGKEVRQGCPLSSLLFNLLLADLEKEIGRVKWEIKLGEGKVYTLAYADDIVLIAEGENEMRNRLIGRLKEYLEKKKLELNADKTNVIQNGGRKVREEFGDGKEK
ncbi:neurofilament medium polypeptide-like protein [Lasius niger]|uniref:Neurofilament medium polypeptide-like protein n=1 Tax=Lasius niger TaxID=67767 RepID=A0A0J7K5U7_LASNI|nr:neurofilament medium polypeptide-like protein [Lasius niger]